MKKIIIALILILVIPIAFAEREIIELYKNDSTSTGGFHKPFDYSITIVPEVTAQAGGPLNLTGMWYGTNIMDWRNIYVDDLLIDSMGYDHKISNDTTWYYGIKPRKEWQLYVRQDGNTLYGEDSLIRVEGTISGNSVSLTGTWKIGQSGVYGDCFFIDSDEVEDYQGTVSEDDYYVYVITGSFSGWRQIYDECHYEDPYYWYDSYRTETRTWAGPFAIGTNPLTVDFVDAEDLSRQVTGAAADGKSKAIIRIRGLPDYITHPSQVTVLVGMESGQLLGDGWIEDNTYTETWQAPEDFGGGNPPDGRREIFFYVEVDGEVLDVPQFYLYKPPLILMHGMWASGKSWSKAKNTFINDYFGGNDLLLNVVSYPGDIHFHENLEGIGRFPKMAIDHGKQQGFDEHIVIKQVDIAAHSMGGILSTYYTGSSYYKDDVNRIVTVGTPHSGSEMGNFALYFMYGEMGPLERFIFLYRNPIYHIFQWKMGSFTKGSIEDLQIGSPAIQAYRSAALASDVPVYAIACPHPGNPSLALDLIYGGKILGMGFYYWDHYLNPFTTFFEGAGAIETLWLLLYNPLNVEKGLFGAMFSSDYIVAWESQKGGSTSVRPVDAVDHIHETETPAVIQAFIDILNRPIDQFDQDGFSPPLLPVPSVGVWDIPEATEMQALGLESMSEGAVKITAPANNSVYQPGDNVTVQATYPGDPHLGMYFLSGDLSFGEDNVSPFEFQFEIDEEWLGSMFLTAYIINANGSMEFDTINLNIVTSATPDEIEALPSGPHYLLPGEDLILYVEALYGNITRDITSGSTGTLYSSSNTSVATISSEGIITALSPGTATITITNGISYNMEIYVENTCEIPTNSMIIRKSVKFCPGSYFIPYGFEVDMNNVEIDCQGAVIQGNYTTNGILIENQLGVKIKNCTIRNYIYGIFENNSVGISVIDSNIFYNDFGIYIYNSDSSKVLNNKIHNNGYHGVFSEYSYGLNIDSNQFYSNGLSVNYGYGVYCRYASNANITRNNIFSHMAPNYAYGIKLLQFPNALIENNNIFNNDDNAIQVEFSNNAIIRKNTIKNNSGGPYLSSSNNTLIYNNNFINNTLRGFDNGINFWDNGASIGGNYWDKYDQPAEGCYDTNNNGYCDAPYPISPNGIDNYPFTVPDAWLIKLFSKNLTQGWNLISIPLIPQNNSVGEVFKSISYSDIFTYDSDWETPTNIDVTKGYWIKADTASTLDIQGTVPDVTPIINPGWNLIGHPYLTEQNPLIYSASILSYNGSWSTYIPSKGNNLLQILKPGLGYWVKLE